MHVCRICPTLSFTDEKTYLIHIRDSHDGKPADCQMCDNCGKIFKTGTQLKCHKNSKCGTEKMFPCKECGKKLMSAGSLHNHMKLHKEKAKLMCRFCAKLFHFIGQVKVHEKIHTKEKDFVCKDCGKAFSYRQSLITHMSTHSGVKPYQCEGCGRGFSCVGNLLKHRKTFKDTCGVLSTTSHTVQNPLTKTKVLMNTPDYCRLKEVEMKKSLQEKISRLEKSEKMDKINTRTVDYRYDVGLTEVSSRMQIIENLSLLKNVSNGIVENDTLLHIHQGNMPNLLAMDIKKSDDRTSQEITNTQANSIVNEKVKEYLYMCETCGAIFKHKFMLDDHQNSNCGQVPVHQCKICDKRFSNKHNLAAHIKIHTSEKELLCKFCPKTFRWKGQLKIHERLHTGEKPFTCLFCPSSFTYRESLLIHSYKHTGNKPYVCKCCGWRFSCVGNLKKHKRTHFDSCGLWYREYERRLDKK